MLYVTTISVASSAHDGPFPFVLCPRISSNSVRIFQPNAFPARVVARMSNSTGRRLRLVPVTIPLGPLPPRPRSVAALDLRGYRLISIASSSRHRRLRHLSAPPPSRVQTRSSIPRLPSTLPPLSLQLGRLQTCPSYPFRWCLNQTWLQNIVHRPNSSDGLVVPYSPIAPP